MKQRFLVLALAAAPFIATAEGTYVTFNLGAAETDLKFKDANKLLLTDKAEMKKKSTSVYVEAGLGMYFNQNFRGDISIMGKGGSSNKFKNGSSYNYEAKLMSLGIMGNLVFDVNLHQYFVPYVTAGVGVARTEVKLSGTQGASTKIKDVLQSNKRSKNNLAYQFGAGVNAYIADYTSIGLGLKMVNLGKKFGKFQGLADSTKEVEFEDKSSLIYHFGIKFDF